MRSQTSFLLLAASLLVSLAAEGRASNCAELLKFAGETWATKTSSERAESVVTWCCNREFDSESAATSAAVDASIPIEGVLLGFGLSGSDSSFAQRQRELCSTAETRLAAAQRSEARVQTINATVADAVRICVLQRATGIWGSLEQTLHPSVFKIHISKNGIEFPTLFETFTTAPAADCTPSPKVGDPIGARGLEISCTRREPKEPITVTINTTGVDFSWATASSLPAPNGWLQEEWPPCNPGGAGFIFPQDHTATMTGILFVDAVIKQAANCRVNSVKFRYDCNWPSSGPTWRPFSNSAPERPLANGDVPVRARLDLDDLQDGRGNAVPAGATCQIRALVQYQDGHEVPNDTSFKYGTR